MKPSLYNTQINFQTEFRYNVKDMGKEIFKKGLFLDLVFIN